MVAGPQHVELAGGRYRVLSDLSATELETLARNVNERVANLGPRVTQTAAPAHILAVVALELAQDLQTLQRDFAALLGKLSAQLEPALAVTEGSTSTTSGSVANVRVAEGPGAPGTSGAQTRAWEPGCKR